jgi:hypothetical protein
VKIPPQNPSPITFVEPTQQLPRMVELARNNKLRKKKKIHNFVE